MAARKRKAVAPGKAKTSNVAGNGTQHYRKPPQQLAGKRKTDEVQL
jgi:hypothetical protein